MDWICRLIIRLASISRNLARISSDISGARICSQDAAPGVLPIRKYRPSRKVKLDGAIKSLVVSPVWIRSSYENRNGTPLSGLKASYSICSRSSPESGSAGTPSTLKLFRTSSSMRFSSLRADFTSSASTAKVMYLSFTMPLWPLASWFFSMLPYSSRRSRKASSLSGRSMIFRNSRMELR